MTVKTLKSKLEEFWDEQEVQIVTSDGYYELHEIGNETSDSIQLYTGEDIEI